MLVFAYAPWCGHCQNFKPVWHRFVKQYGSILDIREVNSDEQPDVIERLQVQGFPTVFLLANKNRYEFEGPRTVQGLESFVKEHYNPHLQSKLSSYRSLKN